jgi:hypothetical protein
MMLQGKKTNRIAFSGNPAVSNPGWRPVAFRPRLATGLALSAAPILARIMLPAIHKISWIVLLINSGSLLVKLGWFNNPKSPLIV